MADLQLDDQFYHYENILEHTAPCISVVIHLPSSRRRSYNLDFPPSAPLSLIHYSLLCCRSAVVPRRELNNFDRTRQYLSLICCWMDPTQHHHHSTHICNCTFCFSGKTQKCMPVAKILNMITSTNECLV